MFNIESDKKKISNNMNKPFFIVLLLPRHILVLLDNLSSNENKYKRLYQFPPDTNLSYMHQPPPNKTYIFNVLLDCHTWFTSGLSRFQNFPECNNEIKITVILRDYLCNILRTCFAQKYEWNFFKSGKSLILEFYFWNYVDYFQQTIAKITIFVLDF